MGDALDFINPIGSATSRAAQSVGVDPEVAGLTSTIGTAQAGAQLISPPDIVQTGDPLGDFVRRVSPEATGLVEEGARGAVDLTGQATQQAISQFDPFTGLESLTEQQALLGLSGDAAQRSAISGIPVSDFQRESQARDRETQLRQAAAGGGLGSGATVLGAQQLAGAQTSSNIFNRLAELGGLTDISQAARSSISGLTESGAAREAALLAGIGPQQAAILLGTAAPIVQAQQQQAELAGLQAIGQAGERQQLGQQLLQLGAQSGIFNPQPGLAATQTPGQLGVIPGSQQQTQLAQQNQGLF